MKETHKRSLAKTVTWRLTGSVSTFIISWLVTGSFFVAGTIMGVQFFANTFLYFIHERMWNHIHWGKRK